MIIYISMFRSRAKFDKKFHRHKKCVFFFNSIKELMLCFICEYGEWIICWCIFSWMMNQILWNKMIFFVCEYIMLDLFLEYIINLVIKIEWWKQYDLRHNNTTFKKSDSLVWNMIQLLKSYVSNFNEFDSYKFQIFIDFNF